MTHDEAEDIMNDLAKDKRVIDVDEEYEHRSACKFCSGKFHGENMTWGMFGDVVVVQSNATLGIRLAYRNEGTVSKAIDIKYCPMCGRKLEAKDETAGNV